MVDPNQKMESAAASEEASLHLVFRFDSKLFAISVRSVEEVVMPTEINEVPGAARTLCGIMNMRGEALPVLDARELFGQKSLVKREIPDGLESKHLIIVNSGQGKFGLTVDKALKVSRLIPTHLPIEKMDLLEPASSVESYALYGEETILILNPEILGSRS